MIDPTKEQVLRACLGINECSRKENKMKCRNKFCRCNVQGDCNGVVVNNRPSMYDFAFCKFYIEKENKE